MVEVEGCVWVKGQVAVLSEAAEEVNQLKR